MLAKRCLDQNTQRLRDRSALVNLTTGTSWDQSSYAEHEQDGGQFPSAEDESDSGIAEDLNCMSSPHGQKLIVITFVSKPWRLSVCCPVMACVLCFFFMLFHVLEVLLCVCLRQEPQPWEAWIFTLLQFSACILSLSSFQVPGLLFFDRSPMAHNIWHRKTSENANFLYGRLVLGKCINTPIKKGVFY